MRARRTIFGGFALALVASGMALAPEGASSRSGPHSAQGPTAEPVPAFHSTVPAGALPATMSPSLFNEPLAENAYSIAARIKKILYQEPCYCHCDRSQGHGSLLDCYVSKHAAECGICEREDFYAYEQSRKGKTGAQIRDGIERGEWQGVDVRKYESALPAPAK